jgi:hypothetical protein
VDAAPHIAAAAATREISLRPDYTDFYSSVVNTARGQVQCEIGDGEFDDRDTEVTTENGGYWAARELLPWQQRRQQSTRITSNDRHHNGEHDNGTSACEDGDDQMDASWWGYWLKGSDYDGSDLSDLDDMPVLTRSATEEDDEHIIDSNASISFCSFREPLHFLHQISLPGDQYPVSVSAAASLSSMSTLAYDEAVCVEALTYLRRRESQVTPLSQELNLAMETSWEGGTDFGSGLDDRKLPSQPRRVEETGAVTTRQTEGSPDEIFQPMRLPTAMAALHVDNVDAAPGGEETRRSLTTPPMKRGRHS